jgi:hypothetical protein
MAASAANTSREIGAVTGVAILGALVYAQLNADLITRLTALGVPAPFQTIIITLIETGGVGNNSSAAAAGQGDIVSKVVDAAYNAFQTGLHAALYLSAGLMILATVLAAVTLRPKRVDA